MTTSIAKLPQVWWFLCVDCKLGVSFATCKAAWLWLHHNIYACSPAKQRRAWVTEMQRHGTGYNIQPLRISLLSPRSFERGAYGHLSDEGKTMKPPEKSCPLLRVLDSVVCFSPRKSDVLVVRPKSKLQLERFWLVRLVGLAEVLDAAEFHAIISRSRVISLRPQSPTTSNWDSWT